MSILNWGSLATINTNNKLANVQKKLEIARNLILYKNYYRLMCSSPSIKDERSNKDFEDKFFGSGEINEAHFERLAIFRGEYQSSLSSDLESRKLPEQKIQDLFPKESSVVEDKSFKEILDNISIWRKELDRYQDAQRIQQQHQRQSKRRILCLEETLNIFNSGKIRRSEKIISSVERSRSRKQRKKKNEVQRIFWCPICSKGYGSGSAFKKHVSDQHGLASSMISCYTDIIHNRKRGFYTFSCPPSAIQNLRQTYTNRPSFVSVENSRNEMHFQEFSDANPQRQS